MILIFQTQQKQARKHFYPNLIILLTDKKRPLPKLGGITNSSCQFIFTRKKGKIHASPSQIKEEEANIANFYHCINIIFRVCFPTAIQNSCHFQQ